MSTELKLTTDQVGLLKEVIKNYAEYIDAIPSDKLTSEAVNLFKDITEEWLKKCSTAGPIDTHGCFVYFIRDPNDNSKSTATDYKHLRDVAIKYGFSKYYDEDELIVDNIAQSSVRMSGKVDKDICMSITSALLERFGFK